MSHRFGDHQLLLTTNAKITRLPSATSSLGAESLSALGFALPISDGKRRRGGQADDLVDVQRFEKWLNAAADEATQSRSVDLHLADP